MLGPDPGIHPNQNGGPKARRFLFVPSGVIHFQHERCANLPGIQVDGSSLDVAEIDIYASIMPVHLTVYYNTRCPVCDAGIDWQRNKLLALVRAGTVEFKDINEQPDALAHFGASLDDIRRRLHATDEAGRLIVGADVAIALWRLTPGEGWLAALFGNRVALPVTRFGYDRFADLLFAWNKWCGRW